MTKGLKIISVIELILGISGLLFALSNAVLMLSGYAPVSSDSLNKMIVSGLAVVILNSVLYIICGILGLRAAKLPALAVPAAISGGIRLILSVAALIMSFSATEAAACIVPVLYFIFVLLIIKKNNCSISR